MHSEFKTYLPEGFETVNTYLFTKHPETLISFLKSAFHAEEVNRSLNPQNGDISNCILKIGTNSIMISQERGKFTNMRTAFYLFVEDVDKVHRRAIEFGAKEEFEPADMPYEDRQSGIVDPSGNYWWISKRLVKKGYHE